jgi:hypothetical protein
MGLAQELPGMGCKPQNLPLSGELDRTRAALVGILSRITERIGAIHSPAMQREGHSRSISRQRSADTSCRGSNFGAQLGKKLYRIDLNPVISEYIGETEKNLGRVFEAAKGSRAVLFFDEADALFAKRTEVKDRHDRHANIEINYLLRRSEKYRALTILATSNRARIDKKVSFHHPDSAAKKSHGTKIFHLLGSRA